MAAKLTRPESARLLCLGGICKNRWGWGKPKCIDALKVAIRQPVGEMPLEMAQRR